MNKEYEQNIESRLAQTFQRVTPSRTFVNIVRKRFDNTTQPVVMQRFSKKRRRLLFALGGVLSASLLLLTLARVAYYLIGRSKQTA